MESYVQTNALAWDWEVSQNNIWTDGVTEEQIEKARLGELEMILTPFKIVPPGWVSNVKDKKVLALACGGGQQAVLMALAGAQVTLFDISGKQLEQDKKYCEELGLQMAIIQGDMRDLSCFDDKSFDLIFNPTSTVFIDSVHSMYEHCHRILKPGGEFLTSITNPILYLFDEKKIRKGKMKVKYTLPYSTVKSLSEKELGKRLLKHDTLEFSHTLQDSLAGLTDAGFLLAGIYTDVSGNMTLDSFIHDCYLGVRAKKAL